MPTTDSGYQVYLLSQIDSTSDTSGEITSSVVSGVTITVSGADGLTLGDNSAKAESFLASQLPGGGVAVTYRGLAVVDGVSGFYASMGTSPSTKYYFFTKSEAVIGSGAAVTLTPDTLGAGGADYTFCFMPGTRIATPAGERVVESLSIGDLVTTAGGETRAIRWIGRQTVSALFAGRADKLPVRIKAGALAEGVPSRDLCLSPGHALLIDGVLVQAGALVNGTTILREEEVPATFTYYHIETADHAVILAENTPAETFLDADTRATFDNAAEYEAMFAGSPEMPALDLPRAMSHRQVPVAIRQRIAARAAALTGPAVAAA
ncbi:Hint domain-containing protein [Siccirubricoccus sp. KC 17139]|uniref:Hint domain-containing protein n=1 Tax=Siccirubricoccus soli TaxID=2899147 RepID=A0ABT1CYN5_9PROT|nr:Hint domain-containing protein [Siccirubricoccus soli]MCO6414766.1 Hint domain-containing protein [Siccirubricoccus soli]MCP2680896.1 Hint domain-containing protein [Siccirubricoccus soli]